MSEDEDTTTRRPLLNRESVVPLGIAAAITVFASVSAWQVSKSLAENNSDNRNRFERIEIDNRNHFARINDHLADIDSKLGEAATDRWRRGDMQVWIELMRAKNPEITWHDVNK